LRPSKQALYEWIGPMERIEKIARQVKAKIDF